MGYVGTISSMMSEKLIPSACEVDVAGRVAMYALQLASGVPSAAYDFDCLSSRRSQAFAVFQSRITQGDPG